MNSKGIIEAGESEITEFKTSLAEWRDVIELISAFSNRNGVHEGGEEIDEDSRGSGVGLG